MKIVSEIGDLFLKKAETTTYAFQKLMDTKWDYGGNFGIYRHVHPIPDSHSTMRVRNRLPMFVISCTLYKCTRYEIWAVDKNGLRL